MRGAHIREVDARYDPATSQVYIRRWACDPPRVGDWFHTDGAEAWHYRWQFPAMWVRTIYAWRPPYALPQHTTTTEGTTAP